MLQKLILHLFFLGSLIEIAQGQPTASSAKIEKLVTAVSARLTAVFKDFHANPELGFMETRTAAIVEKELKALGYKTMSGIGVTGVVGILENGKGPVVM